ncbi:hypothetical protein D1007_01038 [Hordeum vulgare]|nr:hypothetical protein D1007_01038 [Hordeum vulgare]
MEVTHLADFFITFASMEMCDRVFARLGRFRCCGEPVGFQRWHRSALASSVPLKLFSKLGIEGLRADTWECDAIGQLLKNLGGQLVEILQSDDR